MKKSLFTFFVFSIALLTASPLFSQKAPIKFGKIDKDNFLMTHYPLDSSAHAVVLCDYGYAELEYDSQLGTFYILFNRHIRYKIFDQGGYSFANYSIPLYQPSNGSINNEQLIKFKGCVYNLDNGKITETKVSKKDLLKEETTEDYTLEKIAMPGVKEGSILEMQYVTKSPFAWNLQDWQFQYNIPVRHSEFIVKYPDWFIYKTNFNGHDFEYITVKDRNSVAGTIVINEISSRQGELRPINTEIVSEAINYHKKTFRWVAENMPAFKEEAYISSTKNYLTSIEFELSGTRFPNSEHENFNQSWEMISDFFGKHEKLGSQLNLLKVNSLKKEVMPLISNKTTNEEKIAAIYYDLKKRVLWNEWYGVYANHDIKKTLKEEKGSAADINLLLTALLRAGGFEANPVVLSTRDHGFLKDWSPNRSQFNYLISAVKMDDGEYWLLDATDRSLPINLLPPRCINGKGMMVTKEGHTWLTLNPSGKFRHVQQVKATLNDDLTWVGKMDVKCKDYAARGIRQEFAKEGTEEEYLQMLQNENEGLSIANSSFEDMTTLAREAKASYEVTIEDNVIDGGEMLYFNPMLTFNIDENPFKLQERKYPVDFNYPLEYIYAASFEIPDNYTIEELPETLSIALPDKGGKYSYTLSATGNTINLTSQLKINKYLFLPQEYGGLKEFYNLIVDKMAGQIVLKKKS